MIRTASQRVKCCLPVRSYGQLQSWQWAIVAPGLQGTSPPPGPRSWATWAYHSVIRPYSERNIGRVNSQTGLSHSSPNSSIFANRSSTIGLINSISCWIWEGRFDSMRATMLMRILLKMIRGWESDNNARLERLREKANNQAKFYNIDRKSQIEPPIVRVPALKAY